jgi:hypothetical protein
MRAHFIAEIMTVTDQRPCTAIPAPEHDWSKLCHNLTNNLGYTSSTFWAKLIHGVPQPEFHGTHGHEQGWNKLRNTWVERTTCLHLNFACCISWFLMMPSIATKFQYVNSFLFSFSLTTCFGPYGPSSGEIYNWMLQWTISNTTDPLLQ